MADNRATAMRFLQGKGLTRAQAAGVVGSLMQESGLSTGAKNPSSGALGIGQWLGGRKTNLLKSGKAGSLGGQLDFLWSELEGPENAALKRLQGAHSVEGAVDAFTWGFERPGRAEANLANRVAQGRAALKLAGDSSASPSSHTSTSTETETEPGSSYVPGTISQQLAGALGAKAKPRSGGLSLPSFAEGSLVPQASAAPRKERFDANAAAKVLQAIGPQPRPTTTTTTTTKQSSPSSTGGGKFIGWPTGKQGDLIGAPHQGTHTLGNWQSDNAIDIGVPRGTPMVALQDGVIVKVKHHPQDGGRFAGDQITVRGSNGNEYFYAHGLADVKEGQKVKRGQKLGVTGSANGVAHLHFGQMNGDPRAHTR